MISTKYLWALLAPQSPYSIANPLWIKSNISCQIAKSTEGEGGEEINAEQTEDGEIENTGIDEENPGVETEAEDDQNLPGQVEEEGEDAGEKEDEGDGDDAVMDEETADPAPEEDDMWSE